MTFFRCRRCLYPNTKPDLWFSNDVICSACIAFDRRKDIDWAARERQFLKLVHANRGSTHDVIVACSGGKDSTYQIVKCLELGLRPLAVTATTDHLSGLGRKNLDNVSRLCDHIEVTPNKEVRKRIARFALQEVGDISWCEHHLIWSIPAREAINRDIPIVLYGECPQNEYGAGPAGSETAERLTEPWVHEFGGLLGLRLDDVSDILGLSPNDLALYRHPGDGAMAVWMGSYFPWNGYENFLTAQKHGFTPYEGDVEGSLFGYENLDNYQTGLHDRLRWLKFGYTRADDIASNHIRRGYMTRDYAANAAFEARRDWTETYLGKPYKNILDNIGMTLAEFDKVCNRFTNHAVVEWASKLESYQCYSGTPEAASKERASTQAAA